MVANPATRAVSRVGRGLEGSSIALPRVVGGGGEKTLSHAKAGLNTSEGARWWCPVRAAHEVSGTVRNRLLRARLGSQRRGRVSDPDEAGEAFAEGGPAG